MTSPNFSHLKNQLFVRFYSLITVRLGVLSLCGLTARGWWPLDLGARVALNRKKEVWIAKLICDLLGR